MDTNKNKRPCKKSLISSCPKKARQTEKMNLIQEINAEIKKTKGCKIQIARSIKSTLQKWTFAKLSPIHEAVKLDDHVMTNYLLNVQNVDVNTLDDKGRTSLFYANVTNARVLLKKDVDVNYVSPDGMTALLYNTADAKDKYQLIKMLIMNGADVNMMYEHGKTILCELFERSFNDRRYDRIVDMAVSMDGDINATPATSYTFLVKHRDLNSFIKYWPKVDHIGAFQIDDVFTPSLESLSFDMYEFWMRFKMILQCADIPLAITTYKKLRGKFYPLLYNLFTGKRRSKREIQDAIRYFVRYLPIRVEDIDMFFKAYGVPFIHELFAVAELQPSKRAISQHCVSMLYEHRKYEFDKTFVSRRRGEIDLGPVIPMFSRSEFFMWLKELYNPLPSLLSLSRDAIRARLYEVHGRGYSLFAALENRDKEKPNVLELPNVLYDLVMMRRPIVPYKSTLIPRSVVPLEGYYSTPRQSDDSDSD